MPATTPASRLPTLPPTSQKLSMYPMAIVFDSTGTMVARKAHSVTALAPQQAPKKSMDAATRG